MIRAYQILAVILFVLTCNVSCPDQWSTFHGDNQRTGLTNVNFAQPQLTKVWTFDLGEHAWAYSKGISVWSSCAVFGDVKGDIRLYVGAYNHNLYCLDARTGKEIWTFTTGGALNSAPAFATVDGRAMVFVGSGDRTLYGLDAETGAKVWSYETLPWSYTVGESNASAPLVTEIDGNTIVYAAFWNSDRRPVRTVQYGAVYALNAADGKLVWESKHTSNPLSTPSMSKVGNKPILFLGSEDGCVYSVDARTGAFGWKTTLGHKIYATPMVTQLDGRAVIIVGDFFGMLWYVAADNGDVLGQYKTGFRISSTAAVGKDGTIYVGSQDRCLYAIDAETQKLRWAFKTGKYISASPAVASVANRPAVFITSVDNCMYAIDAESGDELWRFEAGDMLWPYDTRDLSLWSSPSVVDLDGVSLVVYPAYDGKLYAFSDRKDVSGIADAAEQDTASCLPRRTGGYVTAIPFVVGAAFILAGLAVVLAARRKAA